MSLYKKPTPIEMLRGYTRNGDFAIDSTSLYYSYEEAEAYVREDKTAYPGMIISVDDKLRKKTAVYRVSYNRGNNLNQRLILEEIGLGSAGGNLFNFLGTLETLDDLYAVEYPENGDMYIVKTDNDGNEIFNAYICIDNEAEEPEYRWQNINLKIGFASVYADGIITKGLYKSFVSEQNDSLHDSVYFSRYDGVETNDPERNNWLRIEHNENEEDYMLLSSGKTRDLINSIIEGQPPVATVTSDIDINVEAGKEIQPIFTIIFNKNSSGSFEKIKIEKVVNKTITTKIYEGEIEHLDEGNKVTITYQNTETDIVSNGLAMLKYRFTIYHKENELTGYPGGTVETEIEFNGFRSVTYGTNVDSYNQLCKSGDKVILKITPIERNTVNKIYFTVPSELKVNAISYDTQNDYFFKDKFLRTSDATSVTYTFDLPAGSYLNYNCQFTLYL